MKQISLKLYTSLLAILLVPVIAFAQAKTTYVGVNLTTETDWGFQTPTVGIGTTIERQFSKHSGIETGLFYRTYRSDNAVITNNMYFAFIVSEKYISLPVLYKFYSKFINIAAGPSVNYFAGWNQKKGGTPGLTLNTYSIGRTFLFGFLAKASKRFEVGKKLFIEPELRVNPLYSIERTYLGVGVSAKYKL